MSEKVDKWNKLATALSSIVGGVCTGLIATNNMDGEQASIAVSITGIIGTALAAIFASFTGNK